MNSRKYDMAAKLALLVVAVVWGSSLVVVKSSTNDLPPNFLLALRFTIGGLALGIIFHKKFKLLNKTYLIHGGIIGFFLFLAYCSQTIGVTFAMPGKSAFLSSSYCVVVPFFAWAVLGKLPDRYNIMAAALCVIGICLATFTEGISLSAGDGLALLSALLFAAHIVAVSKYSKDLDPILITILQFSFAAAFSFGLSLLTEKPLSRPLPVGLSVYAGILYLSLICTAMALLLQNLGQKYTSASSASLILSLESVFGVIFGILFAGETVSLKMLAGFGFILTAILISELKPALPVFEMPFQHLKRKKKKKMF